MAVAHPSRRRTGRPGPRSGTGRRDRRTGPGRRRRRRTPPPPPRPALPAAAVGRTRTRHRRPARPAHYDRRGADPGAGPVDQGPRCGAPHLRPQARGLAEPYDPAPGPRLRRPWTGVPALAGTRQGRDLAVTQAGDPAVPADSPARRGPRRRLRGRRLTATA